jgi:hypothetical protein
MERRSTTRARIGIRRITEPGLSNSYRTRASKSFGMSIAGDADHQLLLYHGGSLTSFLRNKNRFRESQRLNTFGLERVYRQISPGGARAKITPTPCAPSLAGLV